MIYKCLPFFFSDLLPHNLSGQAQTREFLLKVVDILVDYINDVNDRDEKVLHFKHPEEMLRLLKLDIPNEGVPLQNLIDDCSLTLKHQVKTGKKNVSFLLLFLKSVSVFERVYTVFVQGFIKFIVKRVLLFLHNIILLYIVYTYNIHDTL